MKDRETAVRELVEEATSREEELQGLVVELQEKLEDIADFKQRKDDVESELVSHLEAPESRGKAERTPGGTKQTRSAEVRSGG